MFLNGEPANALSRKVISQCSCSVTVRSCTSPSSEDTSIGAPTSDDSLPSTFLLRHSTGMMISESALLTRIASRLAKIQSQDDGLSSCHKQQYHRQFPWMVRDKNKSTLSRHISKPHQDHSCLAHHHHFNGLYSADLMQRRFNKGHIQCL
ncbi:hypothetical protein GQR58_026810 [Nymphon striatum]|nr:hypothetical protein GQR58_026810 [Nymphon striatum]